MAGRRGFAAMDQARQREIARKGGRAAHERGTAHEFTSQEAAEAGRKGGKAVSRNRQHMAEIGRRGGKAAHSRGARPQNGAAPQINGETLRPQAEAAQAPIQVTPERTAAQQWESVLEMEPRRENGAAAHGPENPPLREPGTPGTNGHNGSSAGQTNGHHRGASEQPAEPVGEPALSQ